MDDHAPRSESRVKQGKRTILSPLTPIFYRKAQMLERGLKEAAIKSLTAYARKLDK